VITNQKNIFYSVVVNKAKNWRHQDAGSHAALSLPAEGVEK